MSSVTSPLLEEAARGNLCVKGRGREKEVLAWARLAGSCPECQKYRTNEGHDPCIANLPGVANACCGHGGSGGYAAFEDGRIIRGRWDHLGGIGFDRLIVEAFRWAQMIRDSGRTDLSEREAKLYEAALNAAGIVE